MKDNEIKAHDVLPARIEELRALVRGAFELDCTMVDVDANDLLWLLLRAAPAQLGAAIVFWDGIGWFWTHDGETRQGPFSAGLDSLDDAITDAKRAGYKIAAVNRTRGTMPAVSPQPIEQPERQP